MPQRTANKYMLQRFISHSPHSDSNTSRLLSKKNTDALSEIRTNKDNAHINMDDSHIASRIHSKEMARGLMLCVLLVA